jgi:L-lysine exporter family protein LysE/ArgO
MGLVLGMEKSPLIFGLILQSSMIMALGAQNLFVLEKGLLKDRPVLVATICSLCDVALIFMGVLGAGSFFANNESLTLLLKLAGALFLFKYAYGKFREAGLSKKLNAPTELKVKGLKPMVLSALAVTFLNPHVYLDTVVLIGGYSTQFPTLQDRLSFAIGCGLFSIIWFYALSLGASYFSSALSKPKTMRFINYATSLIMVYLGTNLLFSV